MNEDDYDPEEHRQWMFTAPSLDEIAKSCQFGITHTGTFEDIDKTSPLPKHSKPVPIQPTKAYDPRRLTDIERKVLRILHANYSDKQIWITMQLLKTKTGRDERSLHSVFQSLADAGYILWQPGQTIRSIQIIRAWEESQSKWWDKYR